ANSNVHVPRLRHPALQPARRSLSAESTSVIGVTTVDAGSAVIADKTAVSLALDPSQRAVLDLEAGRSASVLGAPGTGKTTTLIELVADRVLEHGWSTAEVLALTTGRAAATRLRDAIALRLGVPTAGPM